MTERYRAVLRAQPRAARRVSGAAVERGRAAGAAGADAGERLRLALRAAWAVWRWPCCSRSSCRCAGIDSLARAAGGPAGHAARAAGGAAWAAQALPSLGLRYVQRGTPMRGRRRLRRQPFELDRHRRAAAGGGAVPGVEGRGAGLAGGRAASAGRSARCSSTAGRPRRSGRRRRCWPGWRGATGWRCFPRAPAPTGCGCCRSSRRCSARSSRPGSTGGSRSSR